MTIFQIMYTEFGESENISLPMVLALHDQTRYHNHITKLKAGSRYTVHIRAVQQFQDLKSFSEWVSMDKTTSK